MQLASGSHIPDGLPAAGLLLSEKPCHGVESKNPAPHPGIDERNSTLAIGLRAGLHLEAVRESERARYYSENDARFMSPDPASQNLLQIMNPQRWNKYSYALNSPLVLDDPTGMDAAAVNFSGMVGGFGHEAIVVINPDGSAELASFGPAVKDAAGLWGIGSEPGQVKTYPLPTIQFGADRLPTSASMAALKSALAKDMSTKGETVNPSTVRINYFKTTSQETASLNAWITQQHSFPNWYGAFCIRGARNCATFTAEGLAAGGAITQSQAGGLSIDPNLMFDELEMLAPLNSDSNGNAKVTASECDKEPNGQENCYQD